MSSKSIREKPTAAEVIEYFQLSPLPGEGGYFRETYRSPIRISSPNIESGNLRSAGTAIYYMLTQDSWSALHRLHHDEIHHFYLGDPVELTLLDGGGAPRKVHLGPDYLNGQELQLVVPAGVWQGLKLASEGQWALLGTTMAPGFDFSDCELAPATLLEDYPGHEIALRPLLPKS